jgi:glucokinase
VTERPQSFADAPLVGVDLGGTNIRALVLDGSMEVVGRSETLARAEEGVEPVVRRMADCVREALDRAGVAPEEVAGVGVGAAGLTDWKSGTVLLASNLGWKDVPLREHLSRELGGIRVEVDKDTNAAALAEARLGAGRSFQHFLYVTAGTGIGGGVILNGALYRGATGGAGDIGHVKVDPDGPPCGCGDRGCVEVFASGGGIVARARDALAKRAPEAASSSLSAEGLTAQAVFEAAERGDELAASVIEGAGAALGLVLADYVNINNPEAIVLGGGLLRAGALYRTPVERELRRRALPALVDVVRLVPPQLGEDVGMMGAALLLTEVEPRGNGGGA